MKNPLNLIPVLALAAAALTVLPACKAVPKDAPVSEPAPAVAEAPAEQGRHWFAKKGERRGGKVEAAAPAASEPALQRVVVTGYCSCPLCCGSNANGARYRPLQVMKYCMRLSWSLSAARLSWESVTCLRARTSRLAPRTPSPGTRSSIS